MTARRAARVLAAVVAVAMALLGLTVGAPAAATTDPSRPSTWCDGLLPGQLAFAPAPLKTSPDRDPDGNAIRAADSPDTYVPIIVVHGLLVHSAHTSKRDGNFSALISLTANKLGSFEHRTSLIGQFQDLPNAAVFTFDYTQENTKWVTDAHIGPALGDAIDCLAKASGQKVIVVTHSMGGLATRYALGKRTASGADPGSEVSTVVDFGTPELGSPIASLADGALDLVKGPVTAATEQLLIAAVAACPAPGAKDDSDFCRYSRFLTAMDPASAAVGLAWYSSAVRSLPAYPRNVHVVSLAGVSTYDDGSSWNWLFAPSKTTVADVGDALVPTVSALDAAGEHDTVRCNYTLGAVNALTGQLMVKLKVAASNDERTYQWPIFTQPSPCFHSHLLESIELTNDALGAVNEDIESRHLAFDPFTAAIPTMCGMKPGRLHDGLYPDDGSATDPGRNTPLATLPVTVSKSGRRTVRNLALESPASPRGVVAAMGIGCDSGGISRAPDTVGFYDRAGDLLSSIDLFDVMHAQHTDLDSIVLDGDVAHVTFTGLSPDSVDLADSFLATSADLTYDGGTTLRVSRLQSSVYGLGRTIGFGTIGPLSIDQTLAQLISVSGDRATVDAANPACSAMSFGDLQSPGVFERSQGHLSALASSKGARGRVDVLSWGGYGSPAGSIADLPPRVRAILPRTAAGIGLGSSVEDLQRAYGAKLVQREMPFGVPGSLFRIIGPGGTAMRFFVDAGGSVEEIDTGRVPYVDWNDSCG